MKTIGMALGRKQGGAVTIAPEATVQEAVRMMADRHVSALVVVEGPKVRGIVTERDVVRKIVAHGRSTDGTRVLDVMTPRILYVRPEQPIEEAMALMIEKHIRHLPVLDGDRLVGVVSIRDIVREVIAEQKFMIEQLEQYITH